MQAEPDSGRPSVAVRPPGDVQQADHVDAGTSAAPQETDSTRGHVIGARTPKAAMIMWMASMSIRIASTGGLRIATGRGSDPIAQADRAGSKGRGTCAQGRAQRRSWQAPQRA